MSDWEARAVSAGLSYIQSFEIGLTRKKCGKGFKFLDGAGQLIKCKNTRERCLSLVIPPAWKDVWICLDPDGHIQATGIDDAGRKQYIYHPRWHEASATHKYGRLRSFATLLPSIRKHVKTDLKLDQLEKRRVVAAVVRLLDKACIRIGNKQYLIANESRGATTLSAENVSRTESGISLSFKGKSGKQIELTCMDDDLAEVIADCEKSDGEFLFSYETASQDLVPVTSSDVNSYLLEVSKESITAKDFRTWRGSVIALNALSKMESGMSKTAKKKFIAQAVRTTAETLGNTPAVCRQSYIHSSILSAAEDETLATLMRELEVATNYRRTGLTRSESLLFTFLTHLETGAGFSRRTRKQLPLAA